MHDDTELILLALADPIPWVWVTITPLVGSWHATLDWVEYDIAERQTTETGIDALRSPCPWHLTVWLRNKQGASVVHAASLDEAKQFALHHWLTHDLTRITAVHADAAASYRVAVRTYEKKWQTARGSLLKPFVEQKVPYLIAEPTDRDAPEFQMQGKRGRYHARFEPEHRWTVTYTGLDNTTEQRCFLARTFVEMGCAYHAHTGLWRGTLKKTSGMDSSSL